jgi:protein-disulfide isomerase-like protein with CxxC motif
MRRLWQEVAATTGQRFAELPVTAYVHNSVPACLALEHLRVVRGEPPFALLHELQRRFFTRGEDTTDPGLLLDLLRTAGAAVDTFDTLSNDTALRERLRFQFSMARSFGTEAMPSVLLRRGTDTRLLAGGYLDAAMLEEVIRNADAGG